MATYLKGHHHAHIHKIYVNKQYVQENIQSLAIRKMQIKTIINTMSCLMIDKTEQTVLSADKDIKQVACACATGVMRTESFSLENYYKIK